MRFPLAALSLLAACSSGGILSPDGALCEDDADCASGECRRLVDGEARCWGVGYTGCVVLYDRQDLMAACAAQMVDGAAFYCGPVVTGDLGGCEQIDVALPGDIYTSNVWCCDPLQSDPSR